VLHLTGLLITLGRRRQQLLRTQSQRLARLGHVQARSSPITEKQRAAAVSR
jgi:hypothetical protein